MGVGKGRGAGEVDLLASVSLRLTCLIGVKPEL